MTTPPVVVLVGPQMGENIGACARAMANFGLRELRLVRPRDGWPNAKAWPMAAGADWILDQATVFGTTGEAIADLTLTYATSARMRAMVKEVVTPHHAAGELRRHAAAGLRTGILFGSERAGLGNDDLVLADAVLSIPADPAFDSLNLAQALMVVGYEWYRAGSDMPPSAMSDADEARLATKEEVIGFFDHLEAELDRVQFFFPEHKRAVMIRNLRNLWARAQLRHQDVQTLRGIIVALTGRSRSTTRPGRDEGPKE